MFPLSRNIHRPSSIVWDYFTTVENWRTWSGTALKEVIPGWQQGATLVWASGSTSTITKFIPGSEIAISSNGIVTTYEFLRKNNSLTEVKLSESGAPLDGAHKVALEQKLLQLKLRVEAKPMTG
jgi:hypothetical protein